MHIPGTWYVGVTLNVRCTGCFNLLVVPRFSFKASRGMTRFDYRELVTVHIFITLSIHININSVCMVATAKRTTEVSAKFG